MAYSPDGSTLALAGTTGTVRFWDYRSNTVTRSIRVGHVGYATGPVAFSADGRLLAAPGANSTVGLWSVATGKQVGTISDFPTSARSLAFSPDGTMLVTVGRDTAVRLWSVASRQLVAILSGHTAEVNDAVFTPDGRGLITASADGTARVWDLNPVDEVNVLCAALRGPGFGNQWKDLSPSPGPDPCTNP